MVERGREGESPQCILGESQMNGLYKAWLFDIDALLWKVINIKWYHISLWNIDTSQFLK